jgi:hypothetical protein
MLSNILITAVSLNAGIVFIGIGYGIYGTYQVAYFFIAYLNT